MVSSESTLGVADEGNGEGIQQPRPKRLKSSLAGIKDFTLRIQCEVLELLGILDNSTLSIQFLIWYGGAIRHTIETFEQGTGIKPTAHDIIWCLGYDLHFNLRKEVETWKRVA